MTIIRNSIRCLKCDVEVESKHRHDFRWCPGKHVAVDGGTVYRKRVGQLYHWVDTSIVEGEDE